MNESNGIIDGIICDPFQRCLFNSDFVRNLNIRKKSDKSMKLSKTMEIPIHWLA